jgi:hypothetical protein
MCIRQGSDVQISEAAIDAGVVELMSYDDERDRAADTVRRIYVAVWEQCQSEQRSLQTRFRYP